MDNRAEFDDLKIDCKRWAIQSEILKIGDMEYLEKIHQYIKSVIRQEQESNICNR